MKIYPSCPPVGYGPEHEYSIMVTRNMQLRTDADAGMTAILDGMAVHENASAGT